MQAASAALPRSPYSPLHRPPTTPNRPPTTNPSRNPDPWESDSKISPLGKLQTIRESTSSRGSLAEISPGYGADPDHAADANALQPPIQQLTTANDLSAAPSNPSSSVQSAPASVPMQHTPTAAAAHGSESSDGNAGVASTVSSAAARGLASPEDSASEVATEEALSSPMGELSAEMASLVSEASASDDAQTVGESVASPGSDAGLLRGTEEGPSARQAGQCHHACALLQVMREGSAACYAMHGAIP